MTLYKNARETSAPTSGLVPRVCAGKTQGCTSSDPQGAQCTLSAVDNITVTGWLA